MTPRSITLLSLLLCGAALPVMGQGARSVISRDSSGRVIGTPVERAALLERGGQPQQALAILLPALEEVPADARLLAVAERCLIALDRRAEFVPLVQRARAADPQSVALLPLAVRAFAAVRVTDSAEAQVLAWSAQVSGQMLPFQEWATAAIAVGDGAGATRAVMAARRELRQPDAMTMELAQAHQLAGDWGAASRAWVQVVSEVATFRVPALVILSQAPPFHRTTVRATLEDATAPEAGQLLGLLQARWGNPVDGAARILARLPADRTNAATLLRELLGEFPPDPDQEELRVQGGVLARLAEVSTGEAAVQARVRAARAFADGGQEAESRRLLSLAAADPAAPPDLAATIRTTMLGVLLGEGKAAEAADILEAAREHMTVREYETQRHRLVMAWVGQGEFDRAEAVIGVDSSVSGADAIGRVRLFRGDLVGAAMAFRYAGPFDEMRSQTVSRMAILTVLQAVGDSVSPALGQAYLALERRDTTAARQAFAALASTVRPEGAAELHLQAGRLALGEGEIAIADSLLRLADVADFPGTAAVARLERVRVLLIWEARTEALQLAESLILDFPDSAMVPEARRLRDEVRRSLGGGDHATP